MPLRERQARKEKILCPEGHGGDEVSRGACSSYVVSAETLSPRARIRQPRYGRESGAQFGENTRSWRYERVTSMCASHSVSYH